MERQKFGFPNMPLDPMMESVIALANGRHVLELFEDPHRAWEGEELGLQRTWALKEAPERELVQFAHGCLAKIADVFSKTHSWAGFGPLRAGQCEHFNSVNYQILRESQVFPEVAKAWNRPPTEEIAPAKDKVLLLMAPSDTSTIAYEIPADKSARGWINISRSQYWDREFASMLLYSIDGEVITKNTAVFFRRSEASLSALTYADSDEIDSER